MSSTLFPFTRPMPADISKVSLPMNDGRYLVGSDSGIVYTDNQGLTNLTSITFLAVDDASASSSDFLMRWFYDQNVPKLVLPEPPDGYAGWFKGSPTGAKVEGEQYGTSGLLFAVRDGE